MFKNIELNRLNSLCSENAELKLIVDTMLENHQRIISTISHEVRNPLTLLSGNIQLLDQKIPELSNHQNWNVIKSELEFVNQLLVELSTYNNADNLKLREIDINELLEDICIFFKSGLTTENASFSYELSPLNSIHVDPVNIREVILNLLKNAKEACLNTHSITLTSSNTSDGIIIKVMDTGCGIDPAIVEEIFLPFKTFKQNGSGLGLAISKEIALAHYGDLTVESKLGKGTCFTLFLPFD